MFDKILQTIKDFAESIIDEIEKITIIFVSSLAASIAAGGGAVLIEAAQQAVKAAESEGGSGSEKLAKARAAVIATLQEKGMPVINNAINGAIEAAVANFNADKVKNVNS